MVKKQSLKNQQGEIEFRKKLVKQQVEGEDIFTDEFDGTGIEEILAARMQKTIDDISGLQKDGVEISPYLEIGAERGQRSLVMENDLKAQGVAVDISFDMLKSCDYYKNVFDKEQLPLRICCDANNLPFSTNSLPFVFCYETLHHFPDINPVIDEIHRVLAKGGIFYFNEEPFKQYLRLPIFKSRKIYSHKSLNRNVLQKLFDRFFRDQNCNETDYNIIENENISINEWRSALQLFDDNKIELQSLSVFRNKLSTSKYAVGNFLLNIPGGSISGYCKKSGEIEKTSTNLINHIICPDCLANGDENEIRKNDTELTCSKCERFYPIVKDVIILLNYEKFEVLYPQIFSKYLK